MRITCGFDHAGVPLRDAVLSALKEGGHEALDLGATDDYPRIARTVAQAVSAGEATRGILACGRGVGRRDQGQGNPRSDCE